MNIKYKVWISSFRNISFNYEEEINLDDLGYDEETWLQLSEAEREVILDDYCRELLLNYYVEYGWRKIKSTDS